MQSPTENVKWRIENIGTRFGSLRVGGLGQKIYFNQFSHTAREDRRLAEWAIMASAPP